MVAGKPERPHWRSAGDAAAESSGAPYAASVRAHSETVLRGFYDFHREAGTGPIINPFPLSRALPGVTPLGGGGIRTCRWKRFSDRKEIVSFDERAVLCCLIADNRSQSGRCSLTMRSCRCPT